MYNHAMVFMHSVGDPIMDLAHHGVVFAIGLVIGLGVVAGNFALRRK